VGGGSSAGSGESGDTGEGGAVAGDTGNSGEGGAAGLEPGMVIPVEPGACSETTKWGSPTPLTGVSSNADEQLLSITADELDIVFVRGATVQRAHRQSAADDFGTSSSITIPDGYDVGAGATLSSDGKTLILVATDGQGFAALTRASRTGAFSATADTTPFLGLNQRAVQTLEHYVAPVLAPDGKSLVFTGFTPEPAQGFPEGVEGTAIVYESLWSTASWAMPESISQGLFDGTTAARPLPSGLSSDSRTLFYFDEKTSKEVARFRDRADAPLYTLVDLGARDGAVPNAKCDVVYYSSTGNVLTESN